MKRTLIKGGCVLTMAGSNFTAADVLVEDGVVSEVGTGLRARDAEVIDASGTVVMPGFVDAHRHTWETLFRTMGADGHSPEAFGPHHSPEDLYTATLLGLVGALDAGITTIVDCCGATASPAHIDAALAAHADSGARTVFVHGAAPWTNDDWATGLARTVRAEAAPLVTVAAGPLERDPADMGSTGADWQAARDLGLRIHAHAGSSPQVRSSGAELGKAGLLGDDATLVHVTHLDDDSLDAVAASGAAVALTPSSEMAGGLGAPPIQRLLDRGIRPALGVGSEWMAPGDLFAQMRAMISLQHAAYFDLKLAGKAGLPRLMTTRDVIKHATVDGARAAGLPDEAGTIEVGRPADLILLRTDRPNIHPVNDPIGAVVWGMDTSNVDWVFVAGVARKRAGEIDADVTTIREAAVAARRRVGEAAGVPAGVGGSP